MDPTDRGGKSPEPASRAATHLSVIPASAGIHLWSEQKTLEFSTLAGRKMDSGMNGFAGSKLHVTGRKPGDPPPEAMAGLAFPATPIGQLHGFETLAKDAKNLLTQRYKGV